MNIRRLRRLIRIVASVVVLGSLAMPAAAQQTKEAPPKDQKQKEDNAAKPKPAPAQDWGAIFKMHWQNRVRAFKEQNEQLEYVVLLGDSITEGFDVPKYLAGRGVVKRGSGADVIGKDMAKDDAGGVLQRMDESVFNCAAADVFLMIGINDLGAGRTPDKMEPGYREILKRIKEKAPAIHVHVESLLPCRGNFA